MATDDRFRALIRRIYIAAADEAQWSGALEDLTDEYRGALAGLQYRSGPEGRVASARFVRLDPALVELLRLRFADRNPWVRTTQPFFRAGAVLPTHQTLPIAALRKTAFHCDVLRPAGVLYGFGACVLKRGDDALSFTVVRSEAAGPFEGAELERVRAVLPHLRRAVEVNEQLADLRSTRSALGDGLEGLKNGVAIVNRSGRVLFANRTARAIAADHDGLTITAEGLSAADRHDLTALRRLIDDAVRSSAGDGLSAGGTISIGRPSMKRPYLVLVAPVRLPLDDEASSGLATVFITDPEMRVESPEDHNRRIYGFTRAESRIAQAIVEIGRLPGAAEQLRISRETARWHLKRIYRKVGVDRRAAFIRRMATSTPLSVAHDPSASRHS
jgi:DNA-binding CsgD family transcriptional regulator